jgi:curved DNA-binding protein CbpA
VNLYEILGLGRKATPKEIKEAYRKKARETHPDRGGTNDAFYQVSHAYQVLEDARRRHVYDTTGDDSDLGDQRARLMEELGTLLYTIIDTTVSQGGNIRVASIIATAKNAIQASITQNTQQAAATRKKIQEMKEGISRLSRRDGVEDQLKSMLEHRLQGQEASVINFEAVIQRNEVMLDLLDRYDYRSDAALQKQPAWDGSVNVISARDYERSERVLFERAKNMQRAYEERAEEARPKKGRRKPVETPPAPPPVPPPLFDRELDA